MNKQEIKNKIQELEQEKSKLESEYLKIRKQELINSRKLQQDKENLRKLYRRMQVYLRKNKSCRLNKENLLLLVLYNKDLQDNLLEACNRKDLADLLENGLG